METIDSTYLNDLVIRAQQGSSNAFAELYAATYQKQYAYLVFCLQDEFLAKDALKESYVRALRELHRMQSPALFLSLLNRIGFHVCREILGDFTKESVRIDRRTYSLQQVENLPHTEAQLVVMRCFQELPPDYAADQLNLSRSSAGRYLKSARRHLQELSF